MNKKTALIISGGSIAKDFLMKVFCSYCPDIVIAADAGLLVAHELQIPVTNIVGDFDSAGTDILKEYENKKDIDIRRFRPEKDASDTEIALRLALELGAADIVMTGCTGTRLDHVWANVQLLSIAWQAGADAVILDAHNRIRLAPGGIVLKKTEQYGKYISLFPLGGAVTDLTLDGFKYPLDKYLLEPVDSRCVSNEIEAEEAVITYVSGMLIMMETSD